MKLSEWLNAIMAMAMTAVLCIGFGLKPTETALMVAMSIGSMFTGANIALQYVLRTLRKD